MTSARRKVEGKISLKKQEILVSQANTVRLEAELRGMLDVLKVLPRDESTSGETKKVLRNGSHADKAYKALKKAGEPLYVDQMLTAMKRAVSKKNRITVANVLAQYARKNEIFSRPAPNTFGLIEWGNNAPTEEGDS